MGYTEHKLNVVVALVPVVWKGLINVSSSWTEQAIDGFFLEDRRRYLGEMVLHLNTK